MDFITTARLLMDLQAKQPSMRYDFVNGSIVIHIPIDENVPKMFDDAARMFEPA